MEKIEQALTSYGLKEKEIKIYITLLKLGSGKVAEIAQKAGVVRETTYLVLDSLIEKSIASYIINDNVKTYIPTSPQKLIEILEEKEKKIRDVLPDMEDLAKYNYKKPSIEFYGGKEGIKTVFHEILKIEENSQIYGLINSKISSETFRFFIQSITNKRIMKNIKSNMIIEPSARGKEIVANDKKEVRESKFSKFVEDLDVGFYVFKDSVAILTFDQKEPIGIIIENEAISKLFLKMHKELWK